MDTQVRTSFIPKKAITAAPSSRRGSGIGVIFFLSLIIFLGSLALAGGMFAYKKFLQQQITAQDQELKRNQAAFEPATIKSLVRLNDRLEYSRQILKTHVAPSAIFNLLERHTLSTVSFTNFMYQRGPDGESALGLGGVTRTYGDVALQSDEIGKAGALKDAIFSGFSVDEDGSVAFDIAAKVDPALILFSSNLASYRAAAAPSSPQTQPE